MSAFSPKTADEKYYLGFDFTEDLDGAGISSATVTVRLYVNKAPSGDPVASMLDNTKQQISGSIVYFWIQAGTEGNYYLVECQVTASDGSIYDGQALIEVKAVK